jgi:hypothetical protein
MDSNIELDGDESRWVEGASEALPRERLHDGDNSDNVSVELRELVGRNPKFLVRAAARELNGVALRRDVVDRKLGHEARVADWASTVFQSRAIRFAYSSVSTG